MNAGKWRADKFRRRAVDACRGQAVENDAGRSVGTIGPVTMRRISPKAIFAPEGGGCIYETRLVLVLKYNDNN
jgi:hypothetical protein